MMAGNAELPAGHVRAPSLEKLLYQSPLALLKVDRHGHCDLMAPVAAQLLVPLAHGGDITNIVAVLAPHLPQVAGLFDPDATDAVVCHALPFTVPWGRGETRRLAISVFRIQEHSWMVWLADAAAPGGDSSADPAFAALLGAFAFLWHENQTQLQRSQSDHIRLNTLLENAGDTTVALDLGGRITLWNRAAETMFGHPRADVLGRRLSELTIVADCAEEYEASFERALQGQATPPFETVRRRRDGSALDVEVSTGPIPDQRGLIVGVCMILRDISERRRSERRLQAYNDELSKQVAQRTEQLSRTSADLRTVLDALPSMVGSWDGDLKNRFANAAYATWFSSTPAKVVGRHMSELLGEELFAKNKPHIDAVMRGEPQTFEREIPAPDGTGVRHTLAHYVPDVDDGGEVRGFYVLVHDISPVKSAQRALHDSEALLQHVGRIGRIGGWWVELATGAVHWSEQTRAIHEVDAGFGPTLQQAIDFYTPEARPIVAQAIADAMAGGCGWDLELPLITARGRPIHVRALCEVEFAGTGAERRPVRLIGAFKDVTQQHEAEVALHTARVAAESANRAKGEFLANMSHEIRTPLNAIVGLAYTLEKQDLPPKQNAMVAQIRTAGRSLMSVVNDVLDLSKIDAGQVELEELPFALAQTLQAEVQMLIAEAQAKGLTLTLDIAPGLPATVVGDPAKLTQMLTNLIGNAIKFTPSGTVQVTAEPADEVMRHGVRLSVTDTGPGISVELQARLFQPFTQADASITRRYGGTGLGLSIVARLARLMGGEVTLHSTEGEGSRFSLLLPLREAESSEQAAAFEHSLESTLMESGGSVWLSGMRLLIADDSALNLDVARHLLEHEGAVVTYCSEGQQVLARLREAANDYDAVLLDVQMPGMDGLETAQRIRHDLGLAALPLIALTAGVLFHERDRALASGMNDFLAKPLDPNKLIRTLRRHVERYRQLSVPVRSRTRPGVEVAANELGVEGIDDMLVSASLRGNRPLRLSMLGRFLAEFGDLAQDALLPSDDAGRRALTARLHKLRGSASVLGAVAVAFCGGQAEQQLRMNADAGQVGSAMQRLADSLAALQAHAEPSLREAHAHEAALDAAAAAPDPVRLDDAPLQALKKLVQQHSLGAIDAFEALAPALRSSLPNQDFVALRAAVLALDFACAAKLLELLQLQNAAFSSSTSN